MTRLVETTLLRHEASKPWSPQHALQLLCDYRQTTTPNPKSQTVNQANTPKPRQAGPTPDFGWCLSGRSGQSLLAFFCECPEERQTICVTKTNNFLGHDLCQVSTFWTGVDRCFPGTSVFPSNAFRRPIDLRHLAMLFWTRCNSPALPSSPRGSRQTPTSFTNSTVEQTKVFAHQVFFPRDSVCANAPTCTHKSFQLSKMPRTTWVRFE